MASKFTEKHEITFYECDVRGRLTLPMLLNIVIKTSESQSDSFDRGTDYVTNLGLGWVITQHEITINRLPEVGEQVAVSTQASTYNKYFCYRDFWIHDKDGNECVKVNSTFVLMDLVTRKMTSVPEELIAPYECEKIKKIKRGMPLTVIEKGEERPYRVRFSDIDGNKHVNNARYLDWMVDSLEYDFLINHTPTFVNIRFDKEVAYGDTITSKSSLETVSETLNKMSCHQVILDETSCAVANIHWQ
ncbi:acyl-[acyl-carrier-protein] thioesterase [Vagococcus intermedius]|uniref:Thioesterase n=1 Tax=Vagococcus intermedius TaxID=2991418 RepID=A0AAF0CVR9_9ENTE|nr:acyl-ACP thioesterase domain-containing protein [Vagococcus intermedius]WEG73869.1 thioesterase [Vagococcus intermedius]WEG75954.1 thioesterase [Vagococcus intermedius]